VTDQGRALTAAAVGAVIGGFVGYMLFSDQGRSLQRRIEPALDDLIRELNSFRGTFTKAAAMAGEGWKILTDIAGENRAEAFRYTHPRQTSPF
jgi:hypothetical protein